ncbi:hypothetical protein L1987_43895 [Smallanthus sonchifolius]|uniref:Uncharacterized protein n=1 Tax=Smallanthus sonchifolius TaxID=185202 RepID=A0ACB9GP91_9ASTR|nr:hypothetical protein L1987_43895 [Smallanthus sonchifolius]
MVFKSIKESVYVFEVRKQMWWWCGFFLAEKGKWGGGLGLEILISFQDLASKAKLNPLVCLADHIRPLEIEEPLCKIKSTVAEASSAEAILHVSSILTSTNTQVLMSNGQHKKLVDELFGVKY